MKFYETHFEEYINENLRENLHMKLNKIYDKFPKNICDLKNLIFFGPSGTGKYTQMLKSIKGYSPTDLKYEKKISITYNKQQYFFKISVTKIRFKKAYFTFSIKNIALFFYKN